MDLIKRYMVHNDTVVVTIADTTEMLKEANKIHKLYNTSLAAFGRTMTMGAIMGSLLKQDSDKLTVQIKGDGEIGSIIVCADKSCKVKGYTQNNAEIPRKENGKLDVAGVVGNGILTVIKDTGAKEPYVGKVRLVSGEIAEDFAYYYLVSEQIPSVVALGVLVSPEGEVLKSGGYLIQTMPDVKEETITLLENISSTVTSVTSLLSQGSSFEEMASIVGGDDNPKEMFEIVPEYKCDCNTKRIEKAVITLGKTEVDDIIKETGAVELCCQFCNKKYNISKERCEELFKKAK